MAKTNPNLPLATFAGGCFWCTESDYKKHAGVEEAISGYTGGHKENPTYSEVSSGRSGHWEAVQVHFNPAEISYDTLLEIFWQHVDPTDGGGQFVDRGAQYRTAIFFHDADQMQRAELSKQQLGKSGRFSKPIVTEILPAEKFYPAESYHQNYYKQNPLHYKFYRNNSGRDKFLKKIWVPKNNSVDSQAPQGQANAKQDNASLRTRLTPLQYQVTQQDATEPPFDNDFWDHKKEGIYVDIISGEPLFSSRDKFNSGTGWPSFTRPLTSGSIIEKRDEKLMTARTEVRSKKGNAHLGHLFNDGPPPTGQRYCINSAALRFIPKESLVAQGYEQYKLLFNKS